MSTTVKWGNVTIVADEDTAVIRISDGVEGVGFILDHDDLLDLMLAAQAAEPIVAGLESAVASKGRPASASPSSSGATAPTEGGDAA